MLFRLYLMQIIERLYDDASVTQQVTTLFIPGINQIISEYDLELRICFTFFKDDLKTYKDDSKI